jgi:ATP-dependent DNA helicase RecG
MAMSHYELLAILRNGENSGVEFKRDSVENYKIAKELVALSNLGGGMLLLGVEDDGSIAGITRNNIEEWVMTTCRDKIRPAIIPFYELIKDLEPGKDIAVVKVFRGFDVHTVWHENRNTYVIRVGSQSREPSPEELARLFQQRGNFRVELRPVTGATMSDLDSRRLLHYFRHVRQQDTPLETDHEGWQNLLFNTELIVDEGITVAALLLFGRTPHRFLPHSGITAVAYPSNEKEYAAYERAVLRGPMTPLLNEADDIIDSGIVEQCIHFIRRNTPIKSSIEEKGGRRNDFFTYPTEVIREALVNALIHRDYLLSGTDIELSIFKDRLEIVSPGRLPNGITPMRMATGCRASRNQLIKDVMRDYRYLEHVGMGVPRKIIKGMKAHNGSSPELIEDGETFTVRLFA